MRKAPVAGQDLLALRLSWLETARTKPSVLRVALLSTYTADPLVPYLGVFLDELGLTPVLEVGPAGQIMQECLRDGGHIGSFRPDVLIVAPRFEDIGEAEELLSYADAALAATDHWESCLIVVLPSIPIHGPMGIGDDTAPGGLSASAAAIREQVRTRVARVPGAYVVDLQPVLAVVGEREALAPEFFKLAKVPYTEPFFAALAHRIVRLLRVRFAGSIRRMILDADSLLLTERQLDRGEVAEALSYIRSRGIRLGLQSGLAPQELWTRLSARHPELGDELLDDVMPGSATDDHVIVTGVGHSGWGSPCVELSLQPYRWLAELDAYGIFDRLDPAVRAAPSESGDARVLAPTSLQDYVKGLNVTVTCRPIEPDEMGRVDDLVARAKDFTLGKPQRQSPGDLTLIAVEVRDRLGDYGLSGAVGLRFVGDTCEIPVFSISCPVLGKGVEEAVFDQVVALALARGATRLVAYLVDTGRNTPTADFLAEAAMRKGIALTVEKVER